jgi:hypothetical protein
LKRASPFTPRFENWALLSRTVSPANVPSSGSTQPLLVESTSSSKATTSFLVVASNS